MRNPVRFGSNGWLPVTLAALFTALIAAATPGGTAQRAAADRGRLHGAGGADGLEVFDANPLYTGGQLLPVARYTADSMRPFTTNDWGDNARQVGRVAADGASILLLRARVPGGVFGSVRFVLESPGDATPTPSPGGLFCVDDSRVLDRSQQGGAIDSQPAGDTVLAVDTLSIGGQLWAFALYRAPRNFDNESRTTAGMNGRGVRIRVVGIAIAPAIVARLQVVRPLVVLLHGTGGDPSNWSDFPLWRNSANELAGFAFTPGNLPFQVDRISFQWVHVSAGPLQDNGASIVPQIGRSLENWRGLTGTAGTQVDLVTHSYGGPVARQAMQTQADPNPLALDDIHNFRAASSWGHGTVHKLIAMAGSHRGTGGSSGVAYLNKFGIFGEGQLRALAFFSQGIDIGAGGIRDQMAISDALLGLGQAPVPCHAFIGSASLPNFPDQVTSASFLQAMDPTDGPYRAAGLITSQPKALHENRVMNFTFNLDYDTPPIGPAPDYAIDPNYDLTLPAYSCQGLLPRRAYTTAADLDPNLLGHLGHRDFLTNALVSQRVQALLLQPTTSTLFARFPANGSVALSPLEMQFRMRQYQNQAMFAAEYLTLGSAQNGAPFPGSCPTFTALRVQPMMLTLRGGAPDTIQGAFAPSPLFVYGEKSGQWTNVQNLLQSFFCPFTIVSSDASVVGVAANPAGPIPVPFAVDFGMATLTITVTTHPALPALQVPVRVEGFPIQGKVVTNQDPPVLDRTSTRPVRFAFLSSRSFDARGLNPATLRIGGLPPVPFSDGSLARLVDVTGEGRLDAVVRIAPASLNLQPGAARISLRGKTLVSALVEGFARAQVR